LPMAMDEDETVKILPYNFEYDANRCVVHHSYDKLVLRMVGNSLRRDSPIFQYHQVEREEPAQSHKAFLENHQINSS
jgi:hypothetical protein